jgi:hypothetical protein
MLALRDAISVARGLAKAEFAARRLRLLKIAARVRLAFAASLATALTPHGL